MKFSTQEEYGLRCLLRIARAGEGASITIAEIGEAEGLGEANAAKLLRVLRIGGFITSARGRDGGYTLARRPEEIGLLDVFAVLGGRLVEEDFCAGYAGTRPKCVNSVDCTLISLWRMIQGAVDGALKDVTLQDLIPAPVILP